MRGCSPYVHKNPRLPTMREDGKHIFFPEQAGIACTRLEGGGGGSLVAGSEVSVLEGWTCERHAGWGWVVLCHRFCFRARGGAGGGRGGGAARGVWGCILCFFAIVFFCRVDNCSHRRFGWAGGEGGQGGFLPKRVGEGRVDGSTLLACFASVIPCEPRKKRLLPQLRGGGGGEVPPLVPTAFAVHYD